MSQSIYKNRTNKIRNIMLDGNYAALITNEINVGYFSGFQHSEGVFLITEDSSYLFVDFRYYEAAQKFSEDCKVICYKNFLENIFEILEEQRISNIFLESSDITVSTFNRYKNFFDKKNIELIADNKLDSAIAEARIIKDRTEFDKIFKAQKIAEKAYTEVLNYIKPGVSEKMISVELEYLMKKYGAERVSFDLITITGKKTSLPHGVPSDDEICDGDFFTMDFGAVYDGYHSDTTRTIAVKYATDEQKEIYNIVLKAQLEALSCIKSGVDSKTVDKAARSVIENAGFGEYFGHATGHGVGLEIHEAPSVSPKSVFTLKEGMVITDEPGIYLPKKFGVRIEDMLYVTESGCENFVDLPKELIIV